MAGPKEYLTEEQYAVWLARHRIVEKARRWRIQLEENPINALDVRERGELPDTSLPPGLEN